MEKRYNKMEKIKSINAYIKNGKKFVVITSNDNKTYSVNARLVEYALKNAKEVKTNVKN